jgi:uncharacterized repeat protein (TIGR01451 family)
VTGIKGDNDMKKNLILCLTILCIISTGMAAQAASPDSFQDDLPPVASFTIGKAMNVAQLEDEARIVSSSGSYSSLYQAEYAINSSPGRYWLTESGQTSNQWLTVKLARGQSHVIDRVTLQGGSYTTGAKDFEIRVSTTGVAVGDFTPILSGTLPQDDYQHEFTFVPVQARYVQLYIFNNHGSSAYTKLDDFQVWTRSRAGGLVSQKEGPCASIVDFSSQYNQSYAAQNAIDDSSTSRWLTGYNQTTAQWLKVQLGGGQSYTINRIRFQSGNTLAAIQEFDVRVSNTTPDDDAFTTIFSGTGLDSTTTQEFSFAPAQARYVQLWIKNNHGAGFVQVNDFEVLNQNGANVAQLEGVGASIIETSSYYYDYTADNVLDLLEETYWQTNSGSITDQGFKLLLTRGESYLIDRVKIRGYGDSSSPQDFEVRVSDTGSDDADFITVLSGTLPEDDLFHWYTFSPVTAKYVQLVISNNHGNSSYIRLYDFQVFTPQQGGAVVPFDDSSYDPDGQIVAWQWDFGDGATSTEQYPGHTYAGPGTYLVRLTVTDDYGFQTTTDIEYTVLGLVITDFSWSPATPAEGETVTFTDNSSGADCIILERTWDIPDLADGHDLQLTATFPDNDLYPVTLTIVDDLFRQASVTQMVPVSNITPTVSANSSVTVNWGETWPFNFSVNDVGELDRSSLRCDLDFGDGQNTVITDCYDNSKVTYAYDLPGVYTTTLQVTDKDEASVSTRVAVSVTRRDSYLIIYGISLTDDEETVIRLGLYDNFDWGTSMENRSLTVTVGAETVTAQTDARGIAVAHLSTSFFPGTPIMVSATYPGDTFYNSTSATKSLVTPSEVLPLGDIVFIFDESGSMRDDQEEVKLRVGAMVNQLTPFVDYQLGLVGFGTNIQSGQAQIHLLLTNQADEFVNAMDGLTTGGKTEPGFNATVLAMDETMGFRDQAAVCAILVSDESATKNISSVAPETKADALAALDSRQAVFLGIVDTSDSEAQQDYGPLPGSLSTKTGGQAFDISSFRQNPEPVLEAIINQCVQHVIESALPDLSISKTDRQATVRPSQILTYTLTISNVGQAGASTTLVTDTLSAHTTFVGASDGGGEQDGLVAWPAFSLAAGAEVTRLVTLQVNSPLSTEVEAITNTAVVTGYNFNGSDPTPDNNQTFDTDTVALSPDLALDVDDGQTTVSPGQTLTYTLTITNLGPQEAVDIVLTDTLAAETIFVAAGEGGSEVDGLVSWPLFNLASGAVTRRTVVVRIEDSLPVGIDTIVNTADVIDDGRYGPDSSPANNSAADIDTLAGGDNTWRDVCVSRRMDITGVGMGEWRNTINPQTLALADPARVSRLLAQVAGRLSAPDSVTFFTSAPEAVTLIEPGSSTSHSYTFEQNLQPTGLITAHVTGDGDPKTPRALVLYAKRAAEDDWTSVGKTTNGFAWAGGGYYTHTEVLTLPPLTEAADLLITAVVIDNDDDTRLIEVEAAAGGVIETVSEAGPTHGLGLNLVTLTLPRVPTGTNRVEITARSPQKKGDSLVLVGVNVSHLCPSTSPDLVIHQENGQNRVRPGQELTYTLTITNVGRREAVGVAVSDTLPAQGISFISASDGGLESGGRVSWPPFILAAGGKATRTVSVILDNPMPAEVTMITNTATVIDDGSYGPDPTPANNIAADVDEVETAPHLTITKSAPALAAPGEPITFTLTVSNTGTATAVNLTIVDPIPLHTAYVSGGILLGDSVSWQVAELKPDSGVSVSLVVTAFQTITNTGYRVSADGGIQADGALPVVVAIESNPNQNEVQLYLPLIIKQ